MSKSILNYNQIQKILPQRYPFVLIDRVVEFKKGESLVAIKNITANEWCFSACGVGQDTGHRSQVTGHKLEDGASRFTLDASQATFPRTLLIEAAAQAALLLYQLSMVKEGENPRYVLGRVKAEFFGDARVGEEVRIVVLATKLLQDGGVSDIQISVSEKTTADLLLIFRVYR